MQSIEVLWQDTLALLHDRLTLVGLEAQRAWRCLLTSFALAICAALFVVIALIAAVAALSVWLWLAGVSIVYVILIAAAINLLGATFCFWLIAKNLAAISFAASLRSVTRKKGQYEVSPAN